MSKSNHSKKETKKVIEFSTISPEKSIELNDLLDVIVDTLNGMGKSTSIKK